MNINKFENTDTFEKFKVKKTIRKKPDDKRVARRAKRTIRNMY